MNTIRSARIPAAGVTPHRLPAAARPWPAATARPQDEACFHGGAFFDAIGDGFDTLERRHGVIPADVLDAWFPPAPAVLAGLREHLDWIVRTSPPTNGEGLVRAIARTRGVPPSSIVLGGGSSDLIFLAFPLWLRRRSRVLLLDPTYGEYAHVLQKVVGCRVDRLPLRREQGYRLHLPELSRTLRAGYDLVVIVNPNSPTGQHVPAVALADAIAASPARTRIWIDETYVEYAGADQSLERLAAFSPRVVVCKSMSKVYALSGVRAAYLVAGADTARALRRRTPPWAVSLPAQVAAVRALESPDYYRERWGETHALRRDLCRGLAALGGLDVVPGVANFLLCHLAPGRPTARQVVAACRREGLFLRDAGGMSASLGERALRVAVRDHGAQQRLLAILARALEAPGRGGRE